MWFTGFDTPGLHTMYVDKPMRGHGLMQATAHVNCVFKDKPSGLVVDYLDLAHEIKAALATYTESGGMGRTALDQDDAPWPEVYQWLGEKLSIVYRLVTPKLREEMDRIEAT